MTKEEKWLLYKAKLEELKNSGKISDILWYLMAKNIRKRLGLPLQE